MDCLKNDTAATFLRNVRFLVPDSQQFNDKDQILRVTGTAEIGRREWLELACKEWAHEQQ